MKVAITANAGTMESPVDLRFGRAKYLIVVDTVTDEHEVVDNSQNLNAAQGAGIQTGKNVANLGVQAVITGNVGPKAFMVLGAVGIKAYLCPAGTTVDQAVQSFKAGKLKQADQANVNAHWT